MVFYMYYLNLFLICSIIGYIVEQSLMYILNNPFNSGLLHGPWVPLYGIASFIVLIIGNIINKLKLNKVIKYILFFILNFILLSLLELISGYLMESLLHIVYWDYSNLPLHLGKYVSFFTSLFWSLYASFFYYIIYPKFTFLKKIPKIITIILYIIFMIDIIYTSYEFIIYN